MRIALAQAAGVPGDVAANLAEVRRLASAARDGGARLIVLPEAFTTGYDIGAGRLADLAEPLDGPVVRALLEASSGIAVLCGVTERDGADVYNTAVLADGGALLAAYRKTHLFGEVDRSAFAPGDRLADPVALDGLRIAVLICFDIEFPEPARALAARGADLIAVPTSLMAPAEAVAETLVPARAMENQIFVAYANRVGREGDLRYVGRSTVAGPDGVLARAGGQDEELLFADLDPKRISRSRARHHYLAERRPELY